RLLASIVSAAPSSRRMVPPAAQRSGLSERFCTETSPRRPCTPVTTPTTTVGSSTSVFDVHHGAVAIALGGRANDGSDRLGRSATSADDLAHVFRGHANAIAGTALVEGLLDRDGVGLVDQLLDEELDEVFHAPSVSDVSSAGASSASADAVASVG